MVLPTPEISYPGVYRLHRDEPFQQADSAEISKWLMKETHLESYDPYEIMARSHEIYKIMDRIQKLRPAFVPNFDLQPPQDIEDREWNLFYGELLARAGMNGLAINVAVSTRTPKRVGETLAHVLKTQCIREFKLTHEGPKNWWVKLPPFMEELAKCSSIEVMRYDTMDGLDALPIPRNVHRLELGVQLDNEERRKKLFLSLRDRSQDSALKTVVHECATPRSLLNVAKAVSESTKWSKQRNSVVDQLVFKGPVELSPELQDELDPKINITVCTDPLPLRTSGSSGTNKHSKTRKHALPHSTATVQIASSVACSTRQYRGRSWTS